MLEANALIVAVDGLRASALGAYGNTTYPTPALDEFAADSFLFDSCFAPAADLPAVYRALWQSHHPLRPKDFAPADKPLAKWFAGRGYETTLLTDDPQVAALATSGGFADCLQIDSTVRERATSASQTSLAQVFAAACEAIAPSGGRKFVWVHARGMYGSWDAPQELQDTLRDEGDPSPVEAIAPPDLKISSADDPDITFRYACAYAAQVMILDACWESLLAAVQSAGAADDWLVSLLGTRGFPLGEHHRIGGIDERLYADQLHTPWLIRLLDGRGRLSRSSALVSHLDLLPTLCDYIGISEESHPSHRDGASVLPLVDKLTASWRDAVLSASTGSRAIRTLGWSFRRDSNASTNEALRTSTGTSPGELFVRPDDRWEANDVASLRSEVALGLSRTIEEVSEQLSTGQPLVPIVLPDELRSSAT